MKICLISPPTVTQFTERNVLESEALRLISEHAPLGILSLAGVLAEKGISPYILDLNRLFYEYLKPGPHRDRDFASYTLRELEATRFDVYGFSTICSTYPLTLRLARGLRADHQNASIIMGGPQASVVDAASLNAFPYIDFVVRGEAEATFPLLLDAISAGRKGLSHISGITYRVGSEVVRNQNAPVIADLDSLPMPAYDLYPHIRDCRYAPLEAGRGCPFACSFCSTNDFFRRRFRMKSPDVLVSQMTTMKARFGIDTFDLVHDMFTVDKKKVLAFCDALDRSGETFYWNCSARTDCLDDELISRMAHSGCIGLFFGIDSGSTRMQQIINKHLDLSEATSRVARSTRAGIKTVVSLITGFHEETRDDLRGTIEFLGDSLRHPKADVQLHLLAPLAETPITTQFREELFYDDIFSDISPAGWRQDTDDRALIVEHRDIFPNFYAVPTLWLDRKYLVELRDFLLQGALQHRQLLLVLHSDQGNLLDVFDEWIEWCEIETRGISDKTRTHDYYLGDSFNRDFREFVRSHYVPLIAKHPDVVSTVVDVEEAIESLLAATPEHEVKRARRRKPPRCSLESVPVLANGVRVIEVKSDYKRILRCLKRRENLNRVPSGQFTLVMARSGGNTRITQLNEISNQLLHSCDGLRTIAEVANDFSSVKTIDGIPTMKVGIYGLASLLRQGLIEAKVATR
jgi:radical SAM superfamily enzyme YgiQ (UPF0313 family)